jgi:hypothetical protein
MNNKRKMKKKKTLLNIPELYDLGIEERAIT